MARPKTPRPRLSRLKAERRQKATSDGAGNRLTAWGELAVIRAEKVAVGGSEELLAAKLRGRTSYRIIVRRSSITEGFKTDDRFTDLDSGEVMNIRAIHPMNEDPRRYLEILAEAGVAVGGLPNGQA